MGWEGFFSLGVVALVFAGLLMNRAPDALLVGSLVLVVVAGIITPQEAFAGFSNTGMLTVGALFVVAAALREILRQDPSFQSRIASLHYEYYSKLEEVERELERHKEDIQCIVAREGLLRQPVIPFGKAQRPELWDYADGVDTMGFLMTI